MKLDQVNLHSAADKSSGGADAPAAARAGLVATIGRCAGIAARGQKLLEVPSMPDAFVGAEPHS